MDSMSNCLKFLNANTSVNATTSPMKLADQIIKRYAQSKFDQEEKDFLPAGYIEKLVTRGTIIQELNDGVDLEPRNFGLGQDELHKLQEDVVQFICEDAKELFAITVLSGLNGKDLLLAMCKFMSKNFCSRDLPTTSDHLSRNFIIPSSISGNVWSSLRTSNFQREQWRFLVPIFSQENSKIILDPRHILPFTDKSVSGKQGAFGLVHKVKIHPAHQQGLPKNPDGSLASLAIKEFAVSANDEDLQQEAADVWLSEVDTLEMINELSHPNLIQRIASIKRGNQHFLVFLWADGGNLREYWGREPQPELTADFVKQIIQQFRGMVDALQKLHGFNELKHIRHGDIKPENILNFPDSDDSRLGTLKISDLGSAKHHSVATRLRGLTAGKAFATTAYQPPESIIDTLKSSSRLYDIWSMGCVALEFLVWALYGFKALKEFTASLEGKSRESSSFFVEKHGNSPRVAYIHPQVRICFDLLSQDPECKKDTALRAFFEIIRTKLLVIDLPGSNLSSAVGNQITLTKADSVSAIRLETKRASAEQVVQDLDYILNHANSVKESYWFSGRNREKTQQRFSASFGEGRRHSTSTLSTPTLLSPNWRPLHESSQMDWDADGKRTGLPNNQTAVYDFVHGQSQHIQDRVHLSNDWNYLVDNKFARRFLDSSKGSFIPPNAPFHSSSLCNKCKKVDFWTSKVRLSDTWVELQSNLDNCSFCRIRWHASKHLNRGDHTSVSFESSGSILKMNDNNRPSLSIYRSSEDLASIIPIQIGFPQLSAARSISHFNILREWLRDCDKNHQHLNCCTASKKFLPTRLIDVGRYGSDIIRLYETRPTDAYEYLALSHPWGKHPPFFRTFRKDVSSFKLGFSVSDLPATFRDAVRVTRELGIQYIWIDSICIVQKDESDAGDFEQEAGRMGQVFGSAYCVLAASSAQGQSDGFLNEREGSQREYVTFARENLPRVFVCNFLDDFNQHVLEGPLNERGWVLQERVFARRTIYFTKAQTYWECGGGVRCETLTKMENKLVSFLGDPNFPEKIASNTSRGERIIFYEDLYKQYSQLAFTNWEDRPIAISGLEKKLIEDLKTPGGFGIFDDGLSLIRRSLLWQRGPTVPILKSITFQRGTKTRVPSWSWMAYQGGIDFLELPLGGVDWHNDKIYSPWSRDRGEARTTDGAENIELRAIARDFDLQRVGANGSKIVYDIPKTEGMPMKCIVMGRRRESGSPQDARHYVLLIERRGGFYKRVGVGFMPGKSIDLVNPGSSKMVKIR